MERMEQDGAVRSSPGQGNRVGRCCTVDMVGNTKFSQEDEEQLAPCRVVRRVESHDNRYMRLNVDGSKSNSRIGWRGLGNSSRL